MSYLQRLLLFIVGLHCLSIPAGAQPQPLEYQVDEGRWAYRSGAPLQLRLTSICTAAGVLTGDLEIQINDGTGGLIGIVRIPDVAYSAGRQQVDYLIPIQAHSVVNSIGFTFLFRERDSQTQRLTGVVYPSVGQLVPPRIRSFAFAIGCAATELERPQDDYEWLAIETYSPARSDSPAQKPMVTIHPRLAAAELPREAVKYLAYDGLVLESGGFNTMSKTQVQALEAWILGGGSLFLKLGHEWPSEQGEFVKRLLARNPNLLTDDVEGKELMPVLRDGTSHRLDYGFGQVCLTTDRTWSRATTADRIEVFADFWRLIPEQRRSVTKNGKLSLQPISDAVKAGYQNYESDPRMRGNAWQVNQMRAQFQARGDFSNHNWMLSEWEMMLSRPHSQSPRIIIDALLPRDVQMVPIWMLILIAIGYIIYIGYGEYIALGKIRRRRWTWFTFPAASLLITLLTIGTAKGYLSSEIEINRAIIRDVTSAGQICREQTLDLHFQSAARPAATILNSQAFTPVANQTMGTAAGYTNPESAESSFTVVDGNPTGQAVAHQTIQQWKPQLNRTVSFPYNQSVPSEIDQLHFDTLPLNDSAKLSNQLRTALPQAVSYGQFRNSGFEVSVSLKDSVDRTTLNILGAARGTSSSTKKPEGVFTLLDKISPSCDTGLFDLVPASNESYRFLAVIEKGDLVIYRWRLSDPSR